MWNGSSIIFSLVIIDLNWKLPFAVNNKHSCLARWVLIADSLHIRRKLEQIFKFFVNYSCWHITHARSPINCTYETSYGFTQNEPKQIQRDTTFSLLQNVDRSVDSQWKCKLLQKRMFSSAWLTRQEKHSGGKIVVEKTLRTSFQSNWNEHFALGKF